MRQPKGRAQVAAKGLWLGTILEPDLWLLEGHACYQHDGQLLFVTESSSITSSSKHTGEEMVKLALLALLHAKPGKEAAVEAFLKSAQPLALEETGTITWYAFKVGPSQFGIFDTFTDEAGRTGHLTGQIAKALMAQAEELFDPLPQIEKLEILASKDL
jgi:quinol monooxygenase YgiN